MKLDPWVLIWFKPRTFHEPYVTTFKNTFKVCFLKTSNFRWTSPLTHRERYFCLQIKYLVLNRLTRLGGDWYVIVGGPRARSDSRRERYNQPAQLYTTEWSHLVTRHLLLLRPSYTTIYDTRHYDGTRKLHASLIAG